MHRFFVPPTAVQDGAVAFSADQARQMARVLRLQPGETVLALDGLGAEHTVTLGSVTPTTATGSVTATAVAAGEAAVRVTLYQALLKGDRWDYVLQKGTELGVAAFVPVLARRCVAQAEGEEKRRRWERIVLEAAEQSGRGVLPPVAAPVSLAAALPASAGVRLFLHESATTPLRAALPPSFTEVALFVGPEGGFDDREVAEAAAAGAQVVGLGPRILRAETAGAATTAALLYAAGQFG